MSNMPSLNVSFTSRGIETVERSTRGTVLLILRNTTVPEENPAVVLSETDIPTGLSDSNKKYVKMALLGNDTAPQKVICYILDADDEVTDALTWAEKNKADWLAMPTCETEELTGVLKEWVISQRAKNNFIKAVLPNCEADSEQIVNFVTTSVTVGGDTFTAEEMTARIAGMICGTSLEHSVTFATLPEADDCQKMTGAEMETAAGAGKLFCLWDGEKVKLSRGVNSLTTVTAAKGAEFKKIKHVEVLNGIERDIRMLCQDSFIGKYGNSYSNRCLLASAIGSYLEAYVTDGVIDSFEVNFDISAIKSALKTANIDFSEMTDEQITEYDFGTGVYLALTLRLRDAIEDITIAVTI